MTVVELTRAFTFDCYGTLIDWERGIRAALAGVESLVGVDLDDHSRSGFVAQREAVELEVEGEAYRPYDVVLAESLRRTAARFGRSVGAGEAVRFAASLADWEPFPEAPQFLRRLRRTGKPLAILSNATRDGLRGSVRKLDAPFDALITAEDTHTYKPAPQHWLTAQARLGVRPRETLHIAASLQHDVVPASRLGVPVAWVNRRREALPERLAPAFVVRDLDELADALALPPDPASG